MFEVVPFRIRRLSRRSDGLDEMTVRRRFGFFSSDLAAIAAMFFSV
jgi:hypothetical protein